MSKAFAHGAMQWGNPPRDGSRRLVGLLAFIVTTVALASACTSPDSAAPTTPVPAISPAQENGDAEALPQRIQDILEENGGLAAQVADLQAERDLLLGSGTGDDEYESLLQHRDYLLREIEEFQSAVALLRETLEDLQGADSGTRHDADLDPLVEALKLQVESLRHQIALAQGEAGTGEPETTVSGFPRDRLDEAEALAAELRPSVVFIATGGGTGSGFLIEPDLVVTNEHVVYAGGLPAASLTVTTIDGQEYEAQIIDADQPRDVALLRLDRATSQPTVEWGAAADLTPGEPLLTIGHPGRFGRWIVLAGVHQELTTLVTAPPGGEPVEAQTVRSSLPGMTGSSGSPIFNMRGEVVAVLYGAAPITGSGEVFREPAPLRLHSVPVIVRREITEGTAAEQAADLVRQFLGQ